MVVNIFVVTGRVVTVVEGIGFAVEVVVVRVVGVSPVVGRVVDAQGAPMQSKPPL